MENAITNTNSSYSGRLSCPVRLQRGAAAAGQFRPVAAGAIVAIKARPRHRRYDPGPTVPSPPATVSVRRVYVRFATSFARQVARRADPRLGGFKLRNAGPGGGRYPPCGVLASENAKIVRSSEGVDKSLKWYSARPAGVFEIALKGRGDKTRVMVRWYDASHVAFDWQIQTRRHSRGL